ncbi:hypothetical protein AB0N77_21615 [Streptomyces misionensis]|uniref:hypothetical protein n=1 Tax=Streptomyces misionensis TaxID=67331 RepID=UPI0034372307
MPYTPNPAQVRRLAFRLLDSAREDIDSTRIDHAITDDLLNGEDVGEGTLSGADVKALIKAVATAVDSAQFLVSVPGPLYNHAGHVFTLTARQRKLPPGTLVSVSHEPIGAGEHTAWEGADAAFIAEVLYHCDNGLTVIKTADPRRHTRRYPGYTETVETSRLTPS